MALINLQLSLFIFVYILFLFALPTNQNELNLVNACPTSRRLLFFGGFQFPLGQKKSETGSSSSEISTRKSSESRPLVYYRPQTSSELGKKVRSYSYLLRSKLFTREERAQIKKQRKRNAPKKEKKTPKLSSESKSRDLVPVDEQERDRCRALLNLDQTKTLPAIAQTKTKKSESKENKKRSEPPAVPTKVEKSTKKSENNNKQAKQKATPPPAAPPPPPPTKSKGESTPKNVEPTVETTDFDHDEEKNDSVVDRAYHFVKNMFQLSDDVLESNQTNDDEEVTDKHRQSRKLLSIDSSSLLINDFSWTVNNAVPTRHLLAVKNEKKLTKRSNTIPTKPKVGWAYRYRISRYLADQKSKRNTRNVGSEKSGLSLNKKISKRQLLEVENDAEQCDGNQKVNDDSVDTVSIMERFIPKRQLLASKTTEKQAKVKPKSDDEDDEKDEEKLNERRRMKSYEELTDPVAIVESYDRGLFKPRVGWQFRYRVSRYIDSLRENIREDEERLKLGLAAIKRKTPQELSGRRKRVLDKPFTPEPEPVVQENKPNVGWRYRYRISKMMEAKQRGDYIDDEEEKRKARLDQKKKGSGTGRPADDDDDDCLEWEHDLDPELRKIGEEGRRVGWNYRYRIRRRLDELKRRKEETGMPFNWETLDLAGKREKKVATPGSTTSTAEETKPVQENKKAVGWEYRYRVSKMLEAKKQEAAQKDSKSGTRKDTKNKDENLDPELARLTPEERVVGWAYRYRIRRKLDAVKNAARETEAGKRIGEKGSKRKRKEKIIKQVEESIEKILNIDDIDETPFMEYFRRTSSYVLFGLVPTAKKSLCLLPLPVTLSFCDEALESSSDRPTSSPPVPPIIKTKKERTKKDKQKRTVAAETTPSPVKTTTEKVAKKIPQQRSRSGTVNRRIINEKVKHYDEEEEPIRKRIGVESTKQKNKKQYQIIGQEVKVKPKPVMPTTTTTPITTTTTTPVVETTTTTVSSPPSSPAPATKTPRSRPQPKSKDPVTIKTTTTTPPPLSEINQEEASTVLSAPSLELEETEEKIVETPIKVDEDTNESDDEDDGEEDEDEEEDAENDENDDDKSELEETEERKENFDPLALKKLKKYYENAKQSVQDVFDIKDGHDSA